MSNSKQRPYEQENYLASPEIIYYGDRKFNYTVIQEGVYPPVAQLKFTEAPNYFPVPDNYIIKTTWGWSNNCQIIQCSIYYIEEIAKANLKLHDESSKTTQIRHTKGLAKCAQINFENSIQNYYNFKDRVVLKTLEFTVQNKDYYTTFGEKTPNKQKQKLQSVVCIQDVENVPRDAYRYFAAMESKLPWKYAVSQTRQEIDAHMEQLIPINFVDLTPTITPDFSEEPDITDPIIVEQVNSAIGKGAYRSIKKILKYIVPAYIQNEKLDPASPIIHLRISGDGPDTLIRELQELSSIRMVIDNIVWNFKLYFSSDWKFLATCLGFNVANSNYFCPWCEIAKNQRGDRQTEWIISKKMSILNENPKAYPGHHSPPLFNMIPLDHYVPDKLHIILHITVCLWELVLQEIKNEGLFNDITRNIIIKEMEILKIRFEFWKIRNTDNWCYTSLMGNDKLCVLRKFNLAKLFDPKRAALIRSLWNGFAELYDLLGERETNSHYFRLKAKEWYELFLKKTVVNPETNIILVQGLYRSLDLTPYIHILVSHIWEFMLKHQSYSRDYGT
ncbi:hypothetical protein GLOIN_2v1761734 [Rhizophagus irregularis DAOM 181602=DAOM 197198]|nr:hypothetical protein GLOIN_2v1761734 [Rhizophagus irregularis DAOM 181602=DAOM 197198]